MSGEFAAIEAIKAILPDPPAPDQIWIGDDAAVVPSAPGWLLLAADTVVAGVHADLSLTGIDDLGWKAVAASVSDIAAMGGLPGHALVTVSGPSTTDLPLLYTGVAAAAADLACPVVGGDLTNASDLVVTVAVSGRCEAAPVLRGGARPGDLIWVTGPLGGAAAGLRILRDEATSRGRSSPAVDPAQRDSAVRAHARPRALVREGWAARTVGATAMIDVSDGLAADLHHLADRSAVGFRLRSVPVHPAATLAEALGGGEDFQLVFCAPESAALEAAFGDLDAPVAIGRCTADPAERTLDGEPLASSGWEHSW